jgi:hypothetical protein
MDDKRRMLESIDDSLKMKPPEEDENLRDYAKLMRACAASLREMIPTTTSHDVDEYYRDPEPNGLVADVLSWADEYYHMIRSDQASAMEARTELERILPHWLPWDGEKKPPQDGTRVLTLGSASKNIRIVKWDSTAEQWVGPDGQIYFEGGWFSHWMPMPTLPEVEP